MKDCFDYGLWEWYGWPRRIADKNHEEELTIEIYDGRYEVI